MLDINGWRGVQRIGAGDRLRGAEKGIETSANLSVACFENMPAMAATAASP